MLSDEELKWYDYPFENCIDYFVNENEILISRLVANIKKCDEGIRYPSDKEFNSPMMAYDLKRNDYCEKMLQSLLEKE